MMVYHDIQTFTWNLVSYRENTRIYVNTRKFIIVSNSLMKQTYSHIYDYTSRMLNYLITETKVSTIIKYNNNIAYWEKMAHLVV